MKQQKQAANSMKSLKVKTKVKAGGFGKGTKKSTSQVSNKPQLL